MAKNERAHGSTIFFDPRGTHQQLECRRRIDDCLRHLLRVPDLHDRRAIYLKDFIILEQLARKRRVRVDVRRFDVSLTGIVLLQPDADRAALFFGNRTEAPRL